jgi:hypothetical protein
MNIEILKKHAISFIKKVQSKKYDEISSVKERQQNIIFYQSFTKDKILSMNQEDIYQYISKLWAMLIWGNKHYVVDKLINDNVFDHLKKEIVNLVWGEDSIENRWDRFRKQIKGMGPAMMSEILCNTHPNEYMLWNRRAYVGLNYLEVEDLPRYDYQLTGKIYRDLCYVVKGISVELKKLGFEDTTLLAVDYFIWEELQVEDKLSQIFKKKEEKEKKVVSKLDTPEKSDFIHNDIRDKLAEIGSWLGFASKTEQKVAEGSVVDAVWESTIGNLGRSIYVFEVQTKGSIDKLILNLYKAMNNPAVQAVVAVSDKEQIEKIRRHSSDVGDIKKKLKFWDYEEVLRVHESLAYVNESINKLNLVPQGF